MTAALGESERTTLLDPPNSGAPLPLTPSTYRQISRSHPDVGRPESSLCPGADWVSGASTTRMGQVSQLHLTLSPGPKGAQRVPSFAPLRHSSAVSSSVDVDESLGYAPEPAPANQTGSQETRDPIRRQGQETADASVQVTTGTATSTFPQCFTPPQRLTGTGPSRLVALPVLLPYKPHGSEEMFYVSQTNTDTQLSPVRSDTTVESSHPGSDDAVPPRFNTEILGSREQQVDQGVDRGVNIKHTEGIYSKRLRLGGGYHFHSQVTPMPVDESQPMSDQHAPQPRCYSHVTGGLTRGPIPTTTTRGPAIPTTTTRGPAIPTTTTRGPAIPTTTTRGPAIPTTTTRGPAIPTTTTRGPAIPTTTTRGPAIPTTTTRGPAIPTTTTRGPAIPTTTTRGPAIPTTTTRGPAIPTTTTRGPSVAMRDHGTSITTTTTHTQGVSVTDRPVQPSLRCSLGVGEEEQEEFQPLHVEMDYSCMDHHHHFPNTHPTHPLPHPGMEREPGRRDHSLAQWMRGGAWRRPGPPMRERPPLLERLERLSRLIQSTGTSTLPQQQTDTTEQEGGGRRSRERESSKKKEEGRSREGVEEERSRREKGSSRRSNPDAKANQATASGARQAWEGEDCPASYNSSPSHRPARSQYLCPAERDTFGSISGETSSSMSTVDTARLVWAFGAHRVRGQNTGGADSESSTSTYTLPSHRGPSHSKKAVKLVSKGDLEIVSNGTRRHTRDVGTTFPSPGSARGARVPSSSGGREGAWRFLKQGKSNMSQALQGVSSCLFPTSRRVIMSVSYFQACHHVCVSYFQACRHRVIMSVSYFRRVIMRVIMSVSYFQACHHVCVSYFQACRHACHHVCFLLPGVSWYIPAEDLRAESRKENQPEQQPPQGPVPAWFEPYSRTSRPWREPLRQRHIQDRERLTDRLQTNQLEADRESPSDRQHNKPSIITPPGPEPTGNAPAALVRISLQEALELRRPEFVSRSRERVKRLVLQVEERKLQVVFSRERHQLFKTPLGTGDCPNLRVPTPPPVPKPTGTAVFQRAVPTKEMEQRSRQIYEQLPEVQRRREEEKRRE
ncbi:unnamed protein product, partial [Coregonus sp. 'balchen']